MEDEIELDIVDQIFCFQPGLKPWIVIEKNTGEIIESFDMAPAREQYRKSVRSDYSTVRQRKK